MRWLSGAAAASTSSWQQPRNTCATHQGPHTLSSTVDPRKEKIITPMNSTSSDTLNVLLVMGCGCSGWWRRCKHRRKHACQQLLTRLHPSAQGRRSRTDTHQRGHTRPRCRRAAPATHSAERLAHTCKQHLSAHAHAHADAPPPPHTHTHTHGTRPPCPAATHAPTTTQACRSCLLARNHVHKRTTALLPHAQAT
jgi:hypothetical protein